MIITNVEFPNQVYANIWKKDNLNYEDIISYYEGNSFEYEEVSMKAWDFKKYLISELSNG